MQYHFFLHCSVYVMESTKDIFVARSRQKDTSISVEECELNETVMTASAEEAIEQIQCNSTESNTITVSTSNGSINSTSTVHERTGITVIHSYTIEAIPDN